VSIAIWCELDGEIGVHWRQTKFFLGEEVESSVEIGDHWSPTKFFVVRR